MRQYKTGTFYKLWFLKIACFTSAILCQQAGDITTHSQQNQQEDQLTRNQNSIGRQSHKR